MLPMPQVADQINMALACWSPDVLMHERVSEMQETIGYFLEALVRNGLVSEVERTAMSESYVQFFGQFRDDHSDEYALETHDRELLQYGARNANLRRLMQLSFCLSGGVNQNAQRIAKIAFRAIDEYVANSP